MDGIERLQEQLKVLEQETEHKGYYYRATDALTIMICGSFCSLAAELSFRSSFSVSAAEVFSVEAFPVEVFSVEIFSARISAGFVRAPQAVSVIVPVRIAVSRASTYFFITFPFCARPSAAHPDSIIAERKKKVNGTYCAASLSAGISGGFPSGAPSGGLPCGGWPFGAPSGGFPCGGSP